MSAILLCLAILSADKLPVPDADDLERASDLVKEIYGTEQVAAKTAIAKVALANKLIADGLETKDNPAAQFVMLRGAANLAASAGDLPTSMRACEQIESLFATHDSRLAPMKLLLANRAVNGLSVAALEAAESCVKHDAYDSAKEFVQIAESAAGRDVDIQKQARERKALIATIVKEFDSLANHRDTLRTDPANEPANLAIGRFLCFRKSEWDAGLAHLAKAKVSQLGIAAQFDIAGATEAKDLVNIGDMWWSLSDTEDKDACRARAAIWYRKALVGLAGLEKARVEKLLASLPKGNRTNLLSTTTIRFLDWDGKLWSVDCSRGFAVRKEKDGYRVVADFTTGHSLKTILLSDTDATKTTATITITVVEGFVDCSIRNSDGRDGGLGITRIEKGQSARVVMNMNAAQINGTKTEFNGEPPTKGACFSLVVPRKVEFIVHELYVE